MPIKSGEMGITVVPVRRVFNGEVVGKDEGNFGPEVSGSKVDNMGRGMVMRQLRADAGKRGRWRHARGRISEQDSVTNWKTEDISLEMDRGIVCSSGNFFPGDSSTETPRTARSGVLSPGSGIDPMTAFIGLVGISIVVMGVVVLPELSSSQVSKRTTVVAPVLEKLPTPNKTDFNIRKATPVLIEAVPTIPVKKSEVKKLEISDFSVCQKIGEVYSNGGICSRQCAQKKGLSGGIKVKKGSCAIMP